MGKLQNQDHKTLAELVALGASASDLLNADKVYDTKNQSQLSDSLRKNNLSAIAEPTENNDSSEGYEVGSVWSFDEQFWVCTKADVGGAVWSSGGGGAGSPSIFALLTADNDKVANWTETGAGTFSFEETTPLNGKKSYKFATSTTADKIERTVDVPLRSRDKYVHVSLQYKLDVEGMTVSVWDGADFIEDLYLEKTDGKVLEAVFEGQLLGSSTFTFRIENTDGTSMNLEFVDVVFNDALSTIKNVNQVSGWTSYTPSNTQGFGTISSNELEWRRVGDSLQLRGKFVVGSVSGAELQLELPNSYVIKGESTPTVIGRMFRSTATGGRQTILMTGGDTYLNFGTQDNTHVANTGNIVISGEKVSLNCTIPIVGWDANIGHVVTNTESGVDSNIIMGTAPGHGTSSNRIKYFQNTLTDIGNGQSINVVSTAALGTELHILEEGTYNISVNDYAAAGNVLGLSLNSTELTTNIHQLVNDDDLLAMEFFVASNHPQEVTWEGFLRVGDVVRVHTNGYGDNYAPYDKYRRLNISKQAKAPFVAVPVPEYENVYSAKINNNGTASIVSESYPFIEAVSRTAQGNVTVTFKSGIFTEIPSVFAFTDSPTINGNTAAGVYNLTINGCVIATETDAGSNTDYPFNMLVQRQGADYVSPTGLVPGQFAKVRSCVIEDRKPHGTNGGSSSSYTIHTRTLNSIEGGTGWASLSGNQVTLKNGLYLIKATAPARRCYAHQAFLYDVNNLNYFADGSSEDAHYSDGVQTRSAVIKEITVNDTDLIFELRHYIVQGDSQGLGTPLTKSGSTSNNPSSNEVYSRVEIIKLR